MEALMEGAGKVRLLVQSAMADFINKKRCNDRVPREIRDGGFPLSILEIVNSVRALQGRL